MSYRLLLDENIEQGVRHRLENYGHDVEHVDFVPELGKGAADSSIGAYSKRENRIIVTYDEDFVTRVDPDTFRAVLYFDDTSVSPTEIANIVHTLSDHYPQEALQDVELLGREWLRL